MSILTRKARAILAISGMASEERRGAVWIRANTRANIKKNRGAFLANSPTVILSSS
jgi:hypothetical protein